jgi:hypothetical protein
VNQKFYEWIFHQWQVGCVLLDGSGLGGLDGGQSTAASFAQARVWVSTCLQLNHLSTSYDNIQRLQQLVQKVWQLDPIYHL